MSGPVVVCGGRRVDDYGRPYGDRCGATFRPAPRLNRDLRERLATVDRLVRFPAKVRRQFALYDQRPATAVEAVQQATAAGWAVAPQDHPEHTETELVGTCPRCRRPPPEVVELVRERKRINDRRSA